MSAAESNFCFVSIKIESPFLIIERHWNYLSLETTFSWLFKHAKWYSYLPFAMAERYVSTSLNSIILSLKCKLKGRLPKIHFCFVLLQIDIQYAYPDSACGIGLQNL